MKTLLRNFVRMTNGLPGLRELYRFVYRAVASLISFCANAHPAFHSVYLRGSVARGDFQPGKSDLDFVFVIKESVADEDLLPLLKSCRMRFDLLRRIVPFLGEYEVLEVSTVGSWLTCTSDRHEMKPCGRSLQIDLGALSTVELLRRGLADFVYMWWPNVPFWKQPELDRLYEKILRVCSSRPQELPQGLHRRWHQTYHLVCFFESECQGRLKSASSTQLASPTLFDLPSRLQAFEANIETFIESPFDSADSLIVLRPEGTNPEMLAQLRLSADVPLLLTPNSVRFYLAMVSPLHAVSLQRDRKVWGKDIGQALNIEEDDFQKGMRWSAAGLLSHPLTQPIEQELAELHLLGWYLRFKRYFENGVKEVYFHDILRAYEEHQPQYSRRLREALESREELALFSLYREVARDISKAMH